MLFLKSYLGKRDVDRNDLISFFVAATQRIYGAICGPITADPAGEIPTCIREKLKREMSESLKSPQLTHNTREQAT